MKFPCGFNLSLPQNINHCFEWHEIEVEQGSFREKQKQTMYFMVSTEHFINEAITTCFYKTKRFPTHSINDIYLTQHTYK